MKYFFCIFFFSSLLFSQEAKKEDEKKAVLFPERSNAVLFIDVKERSNDLIKTLQVLKKEKVTLKMAIQTKNERITDITNIEPIGSGSILNLKIATKQGSFTKILFIEEILSFDIL